MNNIQFRAEVTKEAQKLVKSFQSRLEPLKQSNKELFAEVKRLRRKREIALESADKSRGVMVGLFIPIQTAMKLALPEGVPAETLHLTLCYLGKEDTYTQNQIAKLRNVVKGFAMTYPIIEGNISGVGRFSTELPGVPDVFYFSYDSPNLEDCRYELWEALERANLFPDRTHGFTPHITLAYISPAARSPMQKVEPFPLNFEDISVSIGTNDDTGERVDYPLQKVREIEEAV